MKRFLALCLTIVLLFTLTACGGVQKRWDITAKNLITKDSVKIYLLNEQAITGNFSNFTVKLDKDELIAKLEKKANINSVTDVNAEYLRLDTDTGEFYIKCQTQDEAESYTYCLFADVGRVENGSQYVYIPFHLFSHYENYEYPDYATPFEGDVTYNSEQYTMDDFAEYYESKGIYTVERRAGNTIIRMTDKETGYRFVLELFPKQNIVLLHNADVEG